MRTRLLVVGAVFLIGIGWAQRPVEEAAAAVAQSEARDATIEQRVEALERLHQSSDAPPSLGAGPGLEARLARIESRLDRLEAQILRSTPGGDSTRYLESRLRALEREVARLRR